MNLSRFASVVLLVVVPLSPLVAYRLSDTPSYTAFGCSEQQKPFVIEVHPGSYLDLVNNPSLDCSTTSRVCLGDFEKNNVEKQIDDYYQYLLAYVKRESVGVRIIPAIDLVENKFHYFYFSLAGRENESLSGTIAGCATETRTKNQTIYQVESTLFDNQ